MKLTGYLVTLSLAAIMAAGCGSGQVEGEAPRTEPLTQAELESMPPQARAQAENAMRMQEQAREAEERMQRARDAVESNN